ncbi:MAG: DMT family transporter [Pseudomonadota bacterium]
MTTSPPLWTLCAIMVLSGVGIPILATWNSALGHQLGSPAAATFVLFAVGFILSGAIVVAVGLPPLTAFTMERPHIYFAAAFMLFYALAVTWAGPKMGIGNAVFFVLLGQIIAAAIIDHFGLWGAIRSEFTVRRMAGIALMALGIYLARKPV